MRFNEPVTGRWTSRDPLHYGVNAAFDPPTSSIGARLGILIGPWEATHIDTNVFQYLESNPVSRNDWLGLFSCNNAPKRPPPTPCQTLCAMSLGAAGVSGCNGTQAISCNCVGGNRPTAPLPANGPGNQPSLCVDVHEQSHVNQGIDCSKNPPGNVSIGLQAGGECPALSKERECLRKVQCKDDEKCKKDLLDLWRSWKREWGNNKCH